MAGSGVRFLVAIGFNAAVAVVFRFFGASLSTCWFTFLGLMGFAALAEIGMRLEQVSDRIEGLHLKIIQIQERQKEVS